MTYQPKRVGNKGVCYVDIPPPSEFHKLKSNWFEFSGLSQWEADTEKKAKEALRTQLLAVFDDIPKGILPFYENSIKKCTELFDAGDFAGLKETIETTPVLVSALETVKTALLKLLEANNV